METYIHMYVCISICICVCVYLRRHLRHLIRCPLMLGHLTPSFSFLCIFMSQIFTTIFSWSYNISFVLMSLPFLKSTWQRKRWQGAVKKFLPGSIISVLFSSIPRVSLKSLQTAWWPSPFVLTEAMVSAVSPSGESSYVCKNIAL